MTDRTIAEKEVIDAVEHLDAQALHRWIELGWVLPHRDGESLLFDASDVARALRVAHRGGQPLSCAVADGPAL